MKIAVISDTHLGFDYLGERSDDSFKAAEEAIEKAIKENVDLILLPGDIYDSRVPKPDIFVRGMKIFSKPLFAGKRNFTGIYSERKPTKLSLSGIPIVAIHGTHERRSKEFMNPVKALEHAGILIHLHLDKIGFEKDGQKIFIHGLSGVPERYAGDILEKWSPEPVEDAKNIFVFHQNIEPYIYSPQEPPTIKLETLPKGFDLYIDGHLHERKYQEFQLGDEKARILLAGSTIQTQLKNESKKGFHILHIDDKINIEFVELKNQRDIKIFHAKNQEDLKEVLEQIEITDQDKEMKPIFKIKINSDIDDSVLQSLKTDCIVSISKNNVDTEKEIETIDYDNIPVEELGMKILTDNFGNMAEPLFDLLIEDDLDQAYNMLMENRENDNESAS